MQTKGGGGRGGVGGGKDKPDTGKVKPVTVAGTVTGKDKAERPRKDLITLNSIISFIDTLMTSLEEKTNDNTNNSSNSKKHKSNAANSIANNNNNNTTLTNTSTTKKKSNSKSSKKVPENLNNKTLAQSAPPVPVPVPIIPPPIEIVTSTIDLNLIDRAFKMAVDIGKLPLH